MAKTIAERMKELEKRMDDLTGQINTLFLYVKTIDDTLQDKNVYVESDLKEKAKVIMNDAEKKEGKKV